MSIPAYPANSNKGKNNPVGDEEAKQEKKVARVTTSDPVQRKKPLGKRIAENLTGDDAKTVGDYLLFDVVLPNFKSLVADVASRGIERLMFGDSAGRRGTSSGRPGGYTSYNTMNRGPGLATGGRAFEPDTNRREMSNQARAAHNFDEIVLRERGEAEMVLTGLADMIESYQVASVMDLYDLVGITGSFTDNKWGWSTMSGSRVVRVRDGYLLELPPTQPIR